MLKRLYIATIAVLIMLAFPMSAQTKRSKSRVNTLQESIAKRKKDIKAQEKELLSLKKNKASTEELVLSLTEQIENRNALIQETSDQIKVLTGEVRAAERRINDLSGQLSKLEKSLREIIRTAYRNYRYQSHLTYIFSADTFADLARRITTLRVATDYRKEQIDEVTAIRNNVKAEREKLAKRREELAAVKKQLDIERKKLNADMAAAKKSIERMTAKEKDVLKAKLENERLNRIDATELSRLRSLAKGNKAGSSFGKGKDFAKGKKLRLPVSNGKVALYKGNMAEIVGAEGAAVTSVYEGKVIQIGKTKKIGMHVVYIAHGEYITSYVNLKEIYVKEGDIVKTNQRIGTIGAMLDPFTGEFIPKIAFRLNSPVEKGEIGVQYIFER